MSLKGGEFVKQTQNTIILSMPRASEGSILRGPALFAGREKELEWLAREVDGRENRFNAIVVSGPRGIGKTSLIQQFWRSREDADVQWFDAHLLTERSFQRALAEFNRSRTRRRIDVVVDGADAIDQERVSEVIRGVWNFKAVRSLIITSTHEIKSRGVRSLQLGPLPKQDAQSVYGMS